MKQSRYESAVWPYSSDTTSSTSYCMKFQDLKSTSWARIEPHHLGAVHMSRASPANRADSILSPLMGA